MVGIVILFEREYVDFFINSYEELVLKKFEGKWIYFFLLCIFFRVVDGYFLFRRYVLFLESYVNGDFKRMKR